MKHLKQTDPHIYQLIKREERRQREVLEMIPSENYTSKAVMEALGSVLTNKYSEGYPKKRYYQGNKLIDDIESLAIERAKQLFHVPYANVQPYSGSPANTAVYFALLNPGDKLMGLSLAFGGHLTHGAPVSLSGKYFQVVPYHLNKEGILDYKEIEHLALKEKPRIIVCGATAYPRIIDFKRFGEIADKASAYLLADVSHIAGLIAGGAHPSPAEHAHIIMTTMHKTLRGPRGAMIMVTQKGLSRDPELSDKIDKAVFPGLQGGPHDNQTAAIAVTLKEASTQSFKRYAKQIVENAKVLAEELIRYKFDLISGGTDNHLLLIDLSNKGVNGAVAALALEVAGIVMNKNAVPNDPMPPFYPSGIRLGTPAITTRGMKEKEMKIIATWIHETIEEVRGQQLPKTSGFDKSSTLRLRPDGLTTREERATFWKDVKKDVWNNKKLLKIAQEVKTLCRNFPLP